MSLFKKNPKPQPLTRGTNTVNQNEAVRQATRVTNLNELLNLDAKVAVKKLDDDIETLKKKWNVSTKKLYTNFKLSPNEIETLKKEIDTAYKQEIEKCRRAKKVLTKRMHQTDLRLVRADLLKIFNESEEYSKMANFNVYNDEDIRSAKLKVYESCRTGAITEDERDEILLHLEAAIDDYNDMVEVYNESVDDMDAEISSAKLAIYEAASEGKISDEMKDFLLETLQ